jgi:hypothetical protein
MFAAGLLLVSTPAFAQEFSSRGDFAVGIDRVFGVHLEHWDRDNPDAEFDATSVELGWGGAAFTPFSVPRLAMDYFVIDHLSIGGSLGFASYSGDPDGSSLILAPRVGYVWNLADWAGFWLRGGFSYHSTDNESGLALTAEPTFVFTPAPHVGLLVGATLDQDVTGSTDAGGPGDRDQHYRDIALLNCGLLVWF